MGRLRRVPFDYEALRIVEKYFEERKDQIPDIEEYFEKMRGNVQVNALAELLNLDFKGKNTDEHKPE